MFHSNGEWRSVDEHHKSQILIIHFDEMNSDVTRKRNDQKLNK